MLRKRSRSSDRTLEGKQEHQQKDQKHGTNRKDGRRFTQPITRQLNDQERIIEELKEQCPDISNKCLLETDF